MILAVVVASSALTFALAASGVSGDTLIPSDTKVLASETCYLADGRPISLGLKKYEYDPTPGWHRDHRALVLALESLDSEGRNRRFWQDYDIRSEFMAYPGAWRGAITCALGRGTVWIAVLRTSNLSVQLSVFAVTLENGVSALLPTRSLYDRRPTAWDERPKPLAKLNVELADGACSASSIQARLEGQSLLLTTRSSEGGCADNSFSFDVEKHVFRNVPKAWVKPRD